MTARAEFLSLSRRELRERLRGGHAIEPRALDDSEYRGTSLGLPAFIEQLTWKTFRKVFHRDPETGGLRGWNVRLEQRGLDGPSVPRLRRGAPWSFGHYAVTELDGYRIPGGLARGLMLDYGRGGNGWLDPVRCLRDPLVALRQGSVDELLGWTYLEVGPFRMGTASFFFLEREGPLSTRVDAPRRARGQTKANAP